MYTNSLAMTSFHLSGHAKLIAHKFGKHLDQWCMCVCARSCVLFVIAKFNFMKRFNEKHRLPLVKINALLSYIKHHHQHINGDGHGHRA